MINTVLRKLKNIIKLQIHKITWRKRNNHNYTTVKNIFPIEKVSVGKKTYGALQINTYHNPNEKITIGAYCSIGGEVKFLLGGEHPYQGLSTYPFKRYVCGSEEDTFTKGPIVVQDDVWIGERCLILSGVTIGQGAVIAAGSVIAKDVPPYAIYAGGRIIKYRFPKENIERLMKLDYSKLDEDSILANINSLYADLESVLEDDNFVKFLSSWSRDE